MRLLVVDDEKVVQNSIALIIKKENLKFVEMETASTGKEAIEKTLSFHPDVVFMDINMPGLNGVDTMKSILRIYPSILFVVVTAYDVFEYAKESLKMGACDYIVKPFVPKRIVETLLQLNERITRRAVEREEILQLLWDYEVKTCFYGHIHGKGCAAAFEGWSGGTQFRLVSADHLGFRPVKICE